MSFPRYPTYKPSGVEWLGEVPSEWKVTPLKSIARVINGFPFDSKLFDPNEGFPLVRIRDLNGSSPDARYKGDFVDSAAISNDDVLIGMDGDFNVGRWLGEIPALLNQRMCCVRADTPMITRYLQYVLPAPLDAINKLTYATTVKHLSSFDVMKIRVAMPPDESCIAEVVSFLDHETVKIDALIAEQQRLIELLQEKRQAVISHAVTKGLNPDAPMKDSGVEWLGEVPEHWALKKIKHTARMESGHTPDRKVEAYWVDCDIPWVSLNDTGFLKDNDYISETAYTINELGIQNSSARLLPERVVVFSRDATIGRCAITTRPMAVSQHFIAWVCGEEILPEYLLLRLKSMTQELERLTFGATLKTIGMPDVKTLATPVPPISEQKEIVDYVAKAVSRLEEMSTKTQTAIELLQERRSALISAAVTGQIDVRGLVPEAVAA